MTATPYDSSKYTDVMVDLETLGTAPGSCIIALGAVFFAANLPEDDWAVYEAPVIAMNSCRAIGLTEDTATHLWWNGQSAEARKVYNAACRNEGEHIVSVLQTFARFFPAGARLWGNGANFDNVLLATAYRHAAVPCPWPYWNDACYRTMKNQFSMVGKPVFQGTQHNALADALHQTRHLIQILDYRDSMMAAYYASLSAEVVKG